MKKQVISAMLADPACDPTSWLGNALIAWIQTNPAHLISDEICRKYVIAAMDENDVSAIAQGVVTYFNESADLKAVQQFVDQVNTMGLDSYSQSNAWSGFASVFRKKSYDSVSMTELANVMVSMARVPSDPTDSFVNFLDDASIKKMIQNWKSNTWSKSTWDRVIDKVDDVTFLVAPEMFSRLDDLRYDYWPNAFQDVLRNLFYKLPKELVPKWFELLKKAEYKHIWSGEYVKHLGKWAYESGDPVMINAKLCPCGFTAKSPQGFTLHQKKCDDSDYGNNPLLYTEAAIRVAALDPLSLICSGCGKPMKSAGGLALHQKKCESDPRYNKARTIDRIDPAGSNEN